MKTLKEIRKQLNEDRGELRRTTQDRDQCKTEIKSQRISLHHHQQASEILKIIGLQTQEQLQYLISEIVTIAMDSVFPDPYQLEIKFIERRNKTECDIYFTRDNKKFNPMEDSGGGAIDIASFALRVASWSIKQPHYRNTIILDEPLKNLSKEYRQTGALMIKEISEKLGIQFIIVTHETSITNYADQVFETIKDKENKQTKIFTK